MARIVVFETKYVKGWAGKTSTPKEFGVVEAEAALHATYRTDAHFGPYHVILKDGTPHSVTPRINKKALPALRDSGCDVRFDLGVLDLDCPAAHKNKVPAPDAWRADIHAKLDLLGPKFGWYQTSRGFRFVWQLPRALPPEIYLQVLAAARRLFADVGLEADALTDWSRLYRLPFVVRDGQAQTLPSYLSPIPVVDISPAPTATPWGASSAKPSSPTISPYSGMDDARVPFELPDRVPAGQRNTILMQFAGQLRFQGLGEGDIFARLLQVDRERCHPPVQDEPSGMAELQSIAKSAARYESGAASTYATNSAASGAATTTGLSAPLAHGSELEIAERIARAIEGPSEKLVFDQGELWRYESGLWLPVFLDEVKRMVCKMDTCPIFVGKDNDGGQKTKPLKVGSKLTKDVYDLVCTVRPGAGWFDGAPIGVAFQNGFLRYDTATRKVTFEPADPRHRVRWRVPLDFELAATAPRFQSYLTDVFRDDADRDAKCELLAEFVGAALFGMATQYQKMLILVGSGGNGKSVFLEIIGRLFPGDALQAIPPQQFQSEHLGAELQFARLNIVNELPDTDILSGESLKALASGDMITRCKKYKAPIKFKPVAAHIFGANVLPGVSDKSEGFWRRWLVVEFNRHFSDEERDIGLASRIFQSELPGVAAWAALGLQRLAENGHYSQPPSSVARLLDWRQGADPVAMFLQERTQPTEGEALGTQASMLFSAYGQWASHYGYKPMSIRKFSERVVLAGLKPEKKTKAGLHFYPVRLLLPQTQFG